MIMKLHRYKKTLNEYNWKGRCSKPVTLVDHTEKRKRGKKSFYLNPEAEWLHTDIQNHMSKPIKIALLQNGGTIKMKTRATKEYGAVSLANTCAFDYIAQGLASSFADSKYLNKLPETSPETNFCRIYKLVKNLIKKNSLQQAYSERLHILLSCFSPTVVHGLAYINCSA